VDGALEARNTPHCLIKVQPSRKNSVKSNVGGDSSGELKNIWFVKEPGDFAEV